MKNTKKTIMTATRIVLSLLAITFIIISMVTDKTTPYLAIGMGLTAICNISGCIAMNRKGKENGSAEDRSFS